MLTKFNQLDYLLFLAIVIVGLFSSVHYFGGRSPYDSAVITDTNPNEALSPAILEYKRIADSLDHLKQCREFRSLNPGKFVSTGLLGYSRISEARDCSASDSMLANIPTNKFFLRLPGYQLETSAEFTIEGGRYVLKHVVWDDDEKDGRQGHYEYKEIPVRFATQVNEQSASNKEGMGVVMLPVSKNKFLLVKILTWTWMAILLVLGIYVLLVQPIRFLHSVAKGSVFTAINIRRLFITGFGLLALAIVPVILGYLLSLFLGSKIPSGINYSLWQAWEQGKFLLLTGLVVLLLAGAFRKGYILKQDSDLTI